uniref:Uncharacterized protein n=1 Tax=Leersia perrieri TaxID=77586 RepID=A0A0D9WBX0_9ORYZ
MLPNALTHSRSGPYELMLAATPARLRRWVGLRLATLRTGEREREEAVVAAGRQLSPSRGSGWAGAGTLSEARQTSYGRTETGKERDITRQTRQ